MRRIVRQHGDAMREGVGIAGFCEDGGAFPQLPEHGDVRKQEGRMVHGGFQHRQAERFVDGRCGEDGGATHQFEQFGGRQFAERACMLQHDFLAVRAG